MPIWLSYALLVLFTLHLAAFGWRAWHDATLDNYLLTLLFGCLSASFALRIWAPAWQIQDIEAYRLLRYTAWAFAVITVPRLLMRVSARFRR